jgi:hypothetical protein
MADRMLGSVSEAEDVVREGVPAPSPVSAIVNPDKLRHLGPVADVRAAARAELPSAGMRVIADDKHRRRPT